MALSPGAQVLALGSNQGVFQLWDMSRDVPQLRATLKHESTGEVVVAFSPDRKTLATGSNDQKLRLWDLSDPEPTLQTEIDTRILNAGSIAFSPDGAMLAITDAQLHRSELWDLSGEAPRQRDDIPLTDGTGRIAFSSTGESLFVMRDTSTIVEFDLTRYTENRSWTLPGPIHDFALSADGRYLATANGNSTAYILCLEEPSEDAE